MSDHTDDYDYDNEYDRESDHSGPSAPSQRGASLERQHRGAPDNRRGQPSIKQNKVYVGNLPQQTTRGDLEKAFGKIGRILAVELKAGYGFIEFEHVQAAEACVDQYHEGEFNGNRIRVEVCRGGAGRPYGACHACGEPGHWAPQCPRTNSRGFKTARGRGTKPYHRRVSPESSGSDSDQSHPSPSKPRLLDRLTDAKCAYERDSYETSPTTSGYNSGDHALPGPGYEDDTRYDAYNHEYNHETYSSDYNAAYPPQGYPPQAAASERYDDYWYNNDAHAQHAYPPANQSYAPRSLHNYDRRRNQSAPYPLPGSDGYASRPRRTSNPEPPEPLAGPTGFFNNTPAPTPSATFHRHVHRHSAPGSRPNFMQANHGANAARGPRPFRAR